MATADSNTLRFDGRVAIVTGAGRGMGRSHAHLLAARGAKVVVNDLGTAAMEGGAPSTAVADEVVDEIRSAGGEAIASPHSVATPEGAQAIVATAVNEWGRVDAIVHNAGIAKFTPLTEMGYDEYRRTLAVHVDGAFLLTQAAWPHMVAQKYGKLLYISSAAGLFGVPSQGAYAVAKTGMIGLMNVARLEGEAYGISVNMLGVAAYTRMTKTMFHDGDSVGHQEMEQWWERYLSPDLVAPPAAWLIHEDCPANGEIFDTKGGHVGRVFLAGTRGYTNIAITPEDVRDNFAEIRDERDYQVFRAGWESAEHSFAEMTKAGAAPAGSGTPSRDIER